MNKIGPRDGTKMVLIQWIQNVNILLMSIELIAENIHPPWPDRGQNIIFTLSSKVFIFKSKWEWWLKPWGHNTHCKVCVEAQVVNDLSLLSVTGMNSVW